MDKKIIILSFFGVVFLSSLCQAKDVAIVINKANPAEELSLKDLSKIFKIEREYWDGEKINILMRESGSWEKEVILKKVYQMSEEELTRLWLGKIFRGEITTFPAVFGSVTMVKKIINDLPSAISFLDSRAVDESLKVLKIEGKLPQEEGYPLRKD